MPELKAIDGARPAGPPGPAQCLEYLGQHFEGDCDDLTLMTQIAEGLQEKAICNDDDNDQESAHFAVRKLAEMIREFEEKYLRMLAVRA